MKRKLKIVGNVVIWTFLVFAAVLTVLAFSAKDVYKRQGSTRSHSEHGS